MTTSAPGSGSSTSASRGLDEDTSTLVALGTSAFAGTMLVVVGLFQLLQGLAAVAENEIYVSGPRYVYELDLSAWGWIHIVVGAVAVATAVGILLRKTWGYTAGIVLAVVSAVTNFLFLPYYPVWSIVVIAFNVAVIWALTTLIPSR